MRAAVLRAYGEDPAVEEVPAPVAADGEVLVRVRAVGLCATDLKVISGALAATTELPVIPGHEIAGEVVEDRSGELAGRRVAVYLYDTCGACDACRSGRPTLCPSAVRPGIERDGGLAELVAVPAENALPFGSSVDFRDAAVAMDAVTTPWSALHERARLRPGEKLAVIGCGGLGSHAIQIGLAVGASVAAIDPDEAHRRLASAVGAEVAVHPSEAQRVREWAGAGVDVALETSGARAGFATAADVLRPGGRIVVNGYAPGVEYGLDSARLVLDEIAVLGSRLGTRDAARASLVAIERGDIRPYIDAVLPLEDAPDALRRLAAGGVTGRMVIAP